jgi:hypothetical protein
MRDQPSVGFLEGDRQNAANLLDCARLTVISAASICSSISADGATLSFAEANSNKA